MYDYEQNSDSYTPPEQHRGMETAAMILGALGLIGSACCYLAIPLSAVGILLALLSRGRNEHMSSRGKTGLWLSIGSLVFTISLTGYTFYQYRDLFTSQEFQEKMRDYLEYYYSGGEADEEGDFLDDFFNESPDEASPYEWYSPYEEDPYGGSSPYAESPYDGYWGTTPYGGSQSGGSSAAPGPAL